MATSELIVIVDNDDPAFVYDSTWSTGYPDPQWYGGTFSYFSLNNSNSSFQYSFHGTSVSFFGHADGQMLSAIDSASATYTPANTSFQIYRSWYTSPGALTDSLHNITLAFATRVYFDCATFAAGPTTSLQGRTVIVDDGDPAMNYTGSWQAQSGQLFTLGSGFLHVPYQQTTHWSNTPGDAVTFQFTGTFVSVVGVFQWDLPGTITTAYVVDGRAPVTNTMSSNGTGAIFSDQPNFEFFREDLQPGNHSLVITVTQITRHQSFTLDFLQYNASFENLSEKPNLTSADLPPMPPLVFPKSKKTPVGAIVGGIVGGVAFVCFIVFLFMWRRRRTRFKRKPTVRVEIDPDPIDPIGGLSFTSEPFSQSIAQRNPPATNSFHLDTANLSPSTHNTLSSHSYPPRSETYGGSSISPRTTSAGSSSGYSPVRHSFPTHDIMEPHSPSHNPNAALPGSTPRLRSATLLSEKGARSGPSSYTSSSTPDSPATTKHEKWRREKQEVNDRTKEMAAEKHALLSPPAYEDSPSP